MAYRLKDEEQTQQVQQNGQQPYAPSGASTDTGGASPQGTSSARPQATSSGSFQNLVGFLNANREGADKLATGVTGKVNTEIGQADSALNTAKTGFENDVKSGTTNYDQSVVDKTIANPTGDTTDIGKLLGASYKGPTDFRQTSYYQPVANEINEVNKLGELGKTDTGRQQILSDIYANPTKNAGTNFKYDNFLLGKSNNFGNVINALNSTAPYTEKLQDQTAALNTEVAPAQQTTQDAVAKASTAITGARDTIQSQIDQAVSDKINSSRETQDAVKAAIATGDFSVLTKIGFTDQDVTSIKNAIAKASFFDNTPTDYTKYLSLTDPTAVYNKNNIATVDQAARWKALNNIVGGTSNYIAPENIINAGTPTGLKTNELVVDTTNKVTQGLLRDAAQREVDMGHYANIDAAMEDATKKMKAAVGEGILEGAAAGYELGGTWIGAVIGAVIGGVVADFKSGTAMEHFYNGSGLQGGVDYDNPVQLVSNPVLHLANALGVSENNFFAKMNMPLSFFDGVFGGGKSSTEKLYDAYWDLPASTPGRYLSPEQMMLVGTWSMGETRDGVKGGNQGLINDLAIITGANGGGNWDGDNQRFYGLQNIAKEAIAEAQANGTLPADSNALAVYSGDRVWSKIVAPYIDKRIGDATGNPNYKGWSTDNGIQTRIGQDITDNIMATGQIPSYVAPKPQTPVDAPDPGKKQIPTPVGDTQGVVGSALHQALASMLK